MSDVDQENVSDCLSLVSSLCRPIIMLVPRCEILPNQPIRAGRGVNNDTLDQSEQSSISVKAIIIKQFSSCCFERLMYQVHFNICSVVGGPIPQQFIIPGSVHCINAWPLNLSLPGAMVEILYWRQYHLKTQPRPLI